MVIKIIVIFIYLFSSYWVIFSYEKEHIYTEDIQLINKENDLHNFEIKVNWSKLPIEVKNQFEFYKISHSTTDPNVKYPDSYIWYTNDIDVLIAKDDFYWYKINQYGKNYYRICIVANKYYCWKTPLIIQLPVQKQEITSTRSQEELSQIKTFLRDNDNAIEYIYSNKFLQEKTQIYPWDKALLAQQLLNFEKRKFDEIQKIISQITKDLLQKNRIINLNTIFEIDNNIDLINRSINGIWEYDLNKEILQKLEEWKKNLTSRKNISESISLWNNSIKNIATYSSKMETFWDLKDNQSQEYYNNKESELNENIAEMKNQLNEYDSMLWSDEISQEEKWIIHKNIETINLDINKVKIELERIEKLKQQNEQLMSNNVKLTLLVIFLFSFIWFWIYKYIKIKKSKNRDIIHNNYKVLQILKTKDEYTIEYEWIYNKWIKVLENTKKSIISWIENFILQTNKLLKTRWILDDLNNLEIDIPNLEATWIAIYKLFINDNIKQKLEIQTENLILKTDEQEIPWEIMHTWNTFLSLKFPIARQIMTRETIRKNEIIKNKIPKILFIINPTWDLQWIEFEAEKIIKKLWNKVCIKLLQWKNATLINIIHELSKKDYDIVF